MTALLLLAGALLLAANAVFVAAEFALVAARRSRMQGLAAAGNARARTALAAMGDLPRTLAGTQLGITMASIGLGFTVEAIVEASVVPVLERTLALPDPVLQVASGALALGAVAAAHTVLGEMVPKNLAVAAPERSALWLAPMIRPFVVAARPILVALSGLADALLRAMRVEPRSELSGAHGVEDIAGMLRLAGREGAIAPAEQDLLERALRFANREVEAVMIPWRDVLAVEAGTPAAAVERLMVAAGHTRLPVLRDGRVLGFVDVLDLQDPAAELPIRPVLVVPRSRRLVDLFEDLRQHSGRLAVVTDRSGHPLGLVTLEDLLRELLGELPAPPPLGREDARPG